MTRAIRGSTIQPPVAFSALDPYLYPPLMGSRSAFHAIASQTAAHRAIAQVVLASGALGAVRVATVREIWERRGAAKWNRVARDFDVQKILVPAGRKLQHSEVASSPALLLDHAGAVAVSPIPSE